MMAHVMPFSLVEPGQHAHHATETTLHERLKFKYLRTTSTRPGESRPATLLRNSGRMLLGASGAEEDALTHALRFVGQPDQSNFQDPVDK